MKKICLVVVAVMLLMLVLSGCDYSNANEATWEQYQEWLIDTFADKYSNPDTFESNVLALRSWSDVNVNTSPWSEIFGTYYYNASTWEEFASLGAGSYTEYGATGTASVTATSPAGSTSGETTASASGETSTTAAAAPGAAGTTSSTATGATSASSTAAAPGAAGGASGQPAA